MEHNKQNSITEIIDQIGLEAAHEIGQVFGQDEFGFGWHAADLSRAIPFDPVLNSPQPDLQAKGWFPSQATEEEKYGQSPINDQATMLLVCTAHIVKELQELQKMLQQNNGRGGV